jgi:hypothetical protein
MTKRAENPVPTPIEKLSFAEALARLVQTDPRELEQAYEKARRAEAEARQFIEERKASIRKGARRSAGRFRP